MHYDEHYEESTELHSGAIAIIRLIRPSDKENLRQGMAELSEESRHLRFFSARSGLSAAELRYLTEVDGVDHLALVAGLPQPDGTLHGIGVARFVRLKDRQDAAEAAIVVVDDMQRNGLGTILLARLGAAALERGITHFVSDFLSGNEGVRKLIETEYPTLDFEVGGPGVKRATIPIPEVAPDDLPGVLHQSAVRRFLTHAAEGALKVLALGVDRAQN